MPNQRVQKYREALHAPKLVTAPSGEQYTVQRLTAMDYIKEGLTDIPNDFFQFVVGITSGNSQGLSEEDEKKNIELFEKYLALTIQKGLIDPPTLLRWEKDKEDTHLVWGEIPVKDQEYIIGCITGRIEDGESVKAPKETKEEGVDAEPEKSETGKAEATT